MGSRSYVFTINNPSGLLDFDALAPHIRYLIYQEEAAPTTGTHHFQGYVEFDKPMRMAAVHKLDGFETAHLQRRLGTRSQAIAYCEKKDATYIDGPYEYGDRRAGGQGSRNDYATLKSLVDNKASDLEIWNEVPDLYLRFFNAIPRVRLLNSDTRRAWKTKVYVHFGDTKLGKSYFCRQKSPNAYWKQRDQWWDGYDGVSDVVLDEFYGWLPFDTLLRMCDENPMTVGIKGSTVGFAPRRIFFTSNVIPTSWYPKISASRFAAFERRVTTWYHWTAARTYTKMKQLILPPIAAQLAGEADPDNNHIE